MHRSQVPIPEPCHENWESMEVAGPRRFCHACREHVHDLSAMSQQDAAALLRSGRSLCVRYVVDRQQNLRFDVPRAGLTRNLVRTALAASALVACTPHGEDTVVPGLDDDVRPALSTDRITRPDRIEEACESRPVPRQSTEEPEDRELMGKVVPELLGEVEARERDRLLELERLATEASEASGPHSPPRGDDSRQEFIGFVRISAALEKALEPSPAEREQQSRERERLLALERAYTEANVP
ncbi:hypothetical protein [Nannocystis punicea]|uniref:Uncharacterized protein n=1 Tax=Nannocystis punicea TaxID=2995304 RepID=A0ABY7H4P7_9BACT|nr:hypothetical protein [Nannocystis poenicansa]WAS94253.1 hypothetical protein O0S08_49660 [Nannocystis poenicansa]